MNTKNTLKDDGGWFYLILCLGCFLGMAAALFSCSSKHIQKSTSKIDSTANSVSIYEKNIDTSSSVVISSISTDKGVEVDNYKEVTETVYEPSNSIAADEYFAPKKVIRQTKTRTGTKTVLNNKKDSAVKHEIKAAIVTEKNKTENNVQVVKKETSLDKKVFRVSPWWLLLLLLLLLISKHVRTFLRLPF